MKGLASKAALCMQCQVCGAACTALPVNGLRPREVVRRAAAGDPALHEGPEPWKCVTCYACESQCRAGIPISDLFYELRNRAAAEGRIPEPYRAVARQVLATGCSFPVTKNTGRMREALGLPPFAVAGKAVEELNALCRTEGLPDPDLRPPAAAPAPGPAAKEA
jgi:heterodisulfide reductase subunit C